MVKHVITALVVAGFISAISAHATANITSISNRPTTGGIAWDKFDATTPQTVGGLDTPEAWVVFNCNQSSGIGSLRFDITTDSADDPVLTLHNTIDNDSGFVWTEYIVTVTMNKAFTFTNTPTVFSPAGWSVGITAPYGPDGFGNWTGILDLTAGTPVGLGETLDFQYQVAFSGSTSYSITESVQVVPEPATGTLLGIGSLVLGGLAWARRRRE